MAVCFKCSFLWVGMILLSVVGQAQQMPTYTHTKISDALLENADAVIRLEKGTFETIGEDKSRFVFHKIVTVLNQNGSEHAIANFSYDKYIKPKSFEAFVFDANGNQIKRARKRDIKDESRILGATLYDDTRVRWADLRQSNYPYTVEYRYEIEYKFLYSIPNWSVISNENTSVEVSEYTVIAPENLKPRYRQYNISSEPDITYANDQTIYHWRFENIPSIELEPFSKGFTDITPLVRVAPSQFSYDGYSGNMSSWDGLASWQNTLNEGRDQLSQETVNRVRSLTANLTSDKQKIKAVYEYMQSRTRYVSIQLGIGGFQPFEAALVDRVGYGDCKALSFYTQSLLKAAGIKSYYTWVDAGPNPRELIRDFPDDSFNHVILCAPNQGDTIWLECTSQTIPFGYLGEFTTDRNVLLITDEGGKIARTPSYQHEENKTVTTANITILSNGNADAYINTQFVGLSYEYADINYYMNLSESEQKDWIHRNINVSNYELFDYSYDEQKEAIPKSNLTLNLGLRQVLSSGGKRQFLAPNLVSQSSYVPAFDPERKSPIYIHTASLAFDTIHFEIPKVLKVDFIPESQVIRSDFGEYEMKVTRSETGVIYVRKLQFNKGKYPAEKYAELVDFMKNIKRADKKKVVLINGT